MSLPRAAKIVEVGPRDGLQNEIKNIPTAQKIKFIDLLSETGLSTIEVTSFVSPRWIPQLADNTQVYKKINKNTEVEYPVLIPNMQGLQAALQVGVKQIAVFTTPSETFCQKNTNCSISESLSRIADICETAKQHNLKIRGYLSCVMGCPYEGDIPANNVLNIATQLIELGCYEISLGDTIGVGTVFKTHELLNTICEQIPPSQLAVHFHDTYGQALVNIYTALHYGIATIDASVGGIGGCPYAKGATGNIATEKVLYLLSGLKIETGVNREKLLNAANFILRLLKK